jgi:hypothetical protein
MRNDQHFERVLRGTRRHFLTGGSLGLANLFLREAAGAETKGGKAKSVIFLHMAGSPSQLELFDYKPELKKYDGKPCPDELLKGKRFAFIKGVPSMLGPQYGFAPRGQAGTMMSELLPHFASAADKVTVMRSMHTDQFNHAPAQLFLHTGSPRLGVASMGAWATYGLGTANRDLPGFVVLISGGNNPDGGKSLWGSGFLPSVYQGVQCRSQGDPVLFLSDPAGISRSMRRKTLDALRDLNAMEQKASGDDEIAARVEQYELAYRMQIAVPEVMDIGREPAAVHAEYGTEPGRTAFANNCLLARRLVENGVRFVQLYHWGWDHHGTGKRDDLHAAMRRSAEAVDRPMTALLKDLEQRGLLDSTLVVWSGEFGRTPMREERNGKGTPFVGRDHHPYAYTIWMAGGGVKRGFNYGETDEIGYYAARDKVSVRDLQATVLHLLGADPYRLSYAYQGLNQRLIGPTDEGRVVQEILV